MTFQAMRERTNWMMEQMRRNAIDSNFEKFKDAARHYYETSEGGDVVTELIHRLEELGANMDYVFDVDFEIREEVFNRD